MNHVVNRLKPPTSQEAPLEIQTNDEMKVIAKALLESQDQTGISVQKGRLKEEAKKLNPDILPTAADTNFHLAYSPAVRRLESALNLFIQSVAKENGLDTNDNPKLFFGSNARQR